MNQRIINLEFKRNKEKKILKNQKELIKNNFPKICIMSDSFGNFLVGSFIKSSIIKDKLKNEYTLIISIKKWEMLSNTLIDNHGEKMSKEALKTMEITIKKYSLPIYKEHDFTNPPIGILLDAEVIDIDGESYLYGDYKIFSKEDIESNSTFNKKMYIPYEESNTLSFDRNFKIDNELKKLIEKLKIKEKNFEIIDSIKKSIEFTPEIIITFVLGGIFTSFLGKIGEDLYDSLKIIIKKMFEKNSDTDLHLILSIKKKLSEDKIVEIQTIVILDKKHDDFSIIMDESIENFINIQLEKIISESLPVSKIVNIKNKEKNIDFAYSLNENGIPYEIKDQVAFKKMLEANKL